MGQYLGGESRQKLFYVPDADNKPVGDKHEISDSELFQFLLDEAAEAETIQMPEILKDVDKNWKIVEFETHQSRKKNKSTRHVFVVFKTTGEITDDRVYWWSLEKNNPDSIVLQRSRNKDSVKNKYDGEERQQVPRLIEKGLKGKGTIRDLFAILWAQQMIPEEHQIWKSNRQSLVTLIRQQMTEMGYESKGFVKNHSPLPENGRNQKMLDLILILRSCCDWPPLFTLIQVGNVHLVDKIVASGQYDINAFYNGLTPLHFAIRLEETKMVQHLLNDPINADPTMRDAFGMSALLLAATITTKAEIFDLLLAHGKVKVDDVDGDGRTALHLAASVSNVIAVQKLIEKGANPNIIDKKGLSPLHVAAQQRDGNPVIDLLLEAQKAKAIGDTNDRNGQGRTALHYAAMASNEITAEHLIQKGADLNHRDNEGFTPLHMAAIHAKDMKIIELLLLKMKDDCMKQYRNDEKLLHLAYRNENLLGAEMAARLTGINRIEAPQSWAGKILEVPTRYVNLFIKAISQVIIHFPQLDRIENNKNILEMDDILKEEEFDINYRDENGETPLFSAIRANNVNWVRRLLETGADPSRRNNKGLTPFQVAATQEKANEIFDLLLASDKVDINEGGKFGLTVLHFALATSNVTAARFLLSKGADPYVADENGVTPLHLAANFPNSLGNSGSFQISDPLKGALEMGNPCGKFKVKFLHNLVQDLVQDLAQQLVHDLVQQLV